MKKFAFGLLACCIVSTVLYGAADAAAKEKAAPAADPVVERGDYLVRIAGCDDCHTPLKMTADGPAPDMARRLSGHPAAMRMPDAPSLPAGPWIGSMSATNTAWAGPWGVSYTSNLTPHATGLGSWDEKKFMQVLRSGQHSAGRPILPPMPWFNYATMSDEDLKAVFAFLRSLPAIDNAVPAAQPPKTAAR